MRWSPASRCRTSSSTSAIRRALYSGSIRPGSTRYPWRWKDSISSTLRAVSADSSIFGCFICSIQAFGGLACAYRCSGDCLVVRFSMSSILIIGVHAAAGSPEIPETAETRDAADLSIGTNNGRCNLTSPVNLPCHPCVLCPRTGPRAEVSHHPLLPLKRVAAALQKPATNRFAAVTGAAYLAVSPDIPLHHSPGVDSAC